MKKKNFHLFAFLFISQFVFFNLSAQKDIDYPKLEKYLEDARQSFDVPGLAIGIYHNGEIVFNKGFGLSNTESEKKVDTETIFGIASCSKAFTAACIAILVDEGKLKWSDKVIDHLPDFQLYDPYITRELRIDDLLCHRSGLTTFDGDLLWYGSDYDRKEVTRRIRYRKNEYSFRESFGYQNVMFIVAGEVIEAVSGKTWEEFLSDRIFEPLEMHSSSATNKDFTKDMNIAWPHIDGKPVEFIDYDNCGPAASINTSTSDLLNWVELMLNKGIFSDDTIFSTRQYYNQTKAHTLLNGGKGEKINETHFLTYGLGWFMFDYHGRKVIQHGGGLPGFHSKVVFVPEENFGYVIIANQISGLVEAAYKKILDIHLTDSVKDWARLYLDYIEKKAVRDSLKIEEKYNQRIPKTKPSLELAQYVGLYEDKMYGLAEISIINNILHLKLIPSKELFSADLNHWHFDTFNFKFKDDFLPEGYLTFVLDGEGKSEYFTIELDNPDFHFYKLKFVKTD